MHLTFICNLLNHACTNLNKLSIAFLNSTISNLKLPEAILPDLRLDILNKWSVVDGRTDRVYNTSENCTVPEACRAMNDFKKSHVILKSSDHKKF